MWHRHRWEVVDRETHPSAFEQMSSQSPESLRGLYEEHFQKPVIVTYKCYKCNAMKVVRV